MDLDMNIDMEVECSAQERLTPESYCVLMEQNDDKYEPTTFLPSPKLFDDKRTFREELDFHAHNPIWGFRYGGEAARRAKKNIMARQDQFLDKNAIQPRQSTSKWNIPFANDSVPIVSWTIMMNKDEEVASRRNTSALFESPNMLVLRAVLLDWLMDICHTCRLKRVTFYLAVDYIDRYLTVKSTVPRSCIQLLGITSLFIAAKMEEIHPPKVSDLSVLCEGRNGACSVEEIFNCEKVLLNTLGWELDLMTPPEWLNVFVQIPNNANSTRHGTANDGFMFPQCSGHSFINSMNLIDLMVLDPGFLNFRYSVIAASALYLFHGASVGQRATGLGSDDVQHCVDYMSAYYDTIKKSKDPQHNIVTPCSSCNYCKSIVEATRLLNGEDVQLIMTEPFSLQTYVNNLSHFEMGIFVRLCWMGYYAIEARNTEGAAKYIKPYEITRTSGSAAEDEGRRRGVFCHSADFLTPGIKINFIEIVERITKCAQKTLSFPRN